MAVDIRERDGSAPKVGKLLRFHEGEYMLREGDANVDMFQIMTGKAEVYLGYGTKQETLIGIINLGMFQINLDANYQKVVKGFVLLAAVVFDIISKKREK